MMKDRSDRDVDCCEYGMPCRKRTRIWNSLDTWVQRPLCQRDCNSMTENRKRHKEVAQRAPNHRHDGNPDDRRRWRQDELYRIPSALVAETEAELKTSLQ